MEAAQTIETYCTLAWLLLLTGWYWIERRANQKERRALEKRFGQLDLREAIHDVVRMVGRKQVHDDARLREAVERLIERLEADPLTASRYLVDLTTLKEQLR